jgi:hypothetical protein
MLMLLKFTDTYEYYYIWQKQPRVNKNYNLSIRVWNYIYVDHQSFICHSDPTQGCGITMPDSYIEPAGQVDFHG